MINCHYFRFWNHTATVYNAFGHQVHTQQRTLSIPVLTNGKNVQPAIIITSRCILLRNTTNCVWNVPHKVNNNCKKQSKWPINEYILEMQVSRDISTMSSRVATMESWLNTFFLEGKLNLGME